MTSKIINHCLNLTTVLVWSTIIAASPVVFILGILKRNSDYKIYGVLLLLLSVFLLYLIMLKLIGYITEKKIVNAHGTEYLIHSTPRIESHDIETQV